MNEQERINEMHTALQGMADGAYGTSMQKPMEILRDVFVIYAPDPNPSNDDKARRLLHRLTTEWVNSITPEQAAMACDDLAMVGSTLGTLRQILALRMLQRMM